MYNDVSPAKQDKKWTWLEGEKISKGNVDMYWQQGFHENTKCVDSTGCERINSVKVFPQEIFFLWSQWQATDTWDYVQSFDR